MKSIYLNKEEQPGKILSGVEGGQGHKEEMWNPGLHWMMQKNSTLSYVDFRLWKFSKSIHLLRTQMMFQYWGSNSAGEEEFVEIRAKERSVLQQKSQDEEKERMGEGKENEPRRGEIKSKSPLGSPYFSIFSNQ